MRGFNRNVDEPIVPVASQKLEDVIQTWPEGNIDVRIGDYMVRPHQRWTITAVPEAGGYLGGSYYKITIEGTDRALAATEDAEVVTVPSFTCAPEQLWRIDQLTDGTYRIMPKKVPTDEQLALVSSGDSTPLAKFDMKSDNSNGISEIIDSVDCVSLLINQRCLNNINYRQIKKLAIYISSIFLLAGCAQKEAPVTFVNEGNPLIRNKFTADPAPLVYDGKLYLYVGHDEYYEGQDSASGGKEFNITEWLCYSTEDMQTWTDHGYVLKPTDFEWGIGEAWASQVIEHEGKFYFYTTVQAGDPYNSKVIGVAVSDNPTGPFKDAIGKPLITDDMTDNGVRGWWNDIDPTFIMDNNGQAWLSWGNGTCFLAKLKPNLIELDGEIETVDLPRYVEGPWLHKRDSLYYLTYASMGAGREAISYATATSMEGPWTPQGELTGMAENSFTIHPGIVEFNNKWYLFYHNATLTLGEIQGAIGRRSVCVDELNYNEDGTMQFVEQTKRGVSKQ